MTEEQIKHMVGRFLAWKLPADFHPDGGIAFKAEFNEHSAHPMRHEPSGTNLFDGRQAEAMVRYIVAGMPEDPALSTLPRERDEWKIGCDAVTDAGLKHRDRALAAEARLEEARQALTQAAAWFAEYAEGHEQKGMQDKAARNRAREKFCANAALVSPPHSTSTGEG